MIQEKKKLAILVPLYNEEDCIKLFFNRMSKVIDQVASKYSVTLYFLNNCSTDKSLEIIKELNSDLFNIKYITYSKNLGYQASLVGGLSSINSDLYFIIDADNEDPPEMLLDFLEKYNEGYKIVFGRRKDRHEFYLIKSLRKVYYRLVHYIADHDFIVDSAEFSLFDNQVKNIILKNNSNSPFVRAELGFAGFKRYGIDYKREKRAAGISNYFITSPTFIIASIISTTSFPLRLIAYTNILIFLYSFMHYLIFSNFFFNISFLIIIFMLELAILAVYIARVYKNQIARPIYTIDYENSNFDY
jgi:polyisoprenyl-phosphate glycosyltransferase